MGQCDRHRSEQGGPYRHKLRDALLAEVDGPSMAKEALAAPYSFDPAGRLGDKETYRSFGTWSSLWQSAQQPAPGCPSHLLNPSCFVIQSDVRYGSTPDYIATPPVRLLLGDKRT